MAGTAPKVPALERSESISIIDKKAETIAGLIRNGKHFIAFTGAGIATSAGIPDFRGPDGNWTLRAQGRTRAGPTTSTLQAIPTATHMALVELQNQGLLKYLVSQNCDGLHRRSGILPENISELHGNSNREFCKDCGKDYIRDFRAVATYETNDHDHRTGRRCTRCGGELHDTIINFGEDLPEKTLELAFDHAKAADLCLVLGSSLTVRPACDVPSTTAANRANTLVICNLQKTPQDKLAGIRVFAKTDALMTKIMEKLGIPIPPFILRRHLVVKVEQNDGRNSVTVLGVDTDGTPVSFLQSVKLLNNRRLMRAEPFTASIRGGFEAGAKLEFELEFMGHYCEPNLTISYEYGGGVRDDGFFLLQFDPSNGEWKVDQEEKPAEA